MKLILSSARVGVITLLLLATPAWGCDLCAVHNSIAAHAPHADSIHIGIAEQFTSYEKLQESGSKVDNTEHQHLESSITQMLGEYDFTDKLAAQIALPYINRRYARFEDGAREQGTEAGIGDLILLARYIPYQYSSTDFTFRTQLFGGLKLPTGNSDALAEEQDEDSALHAGGGEPSARHGGHEDEEGVANAIHGHDLALGSGSVDFPLGAGAFFCSGRFFLSAAMQYVIRTEGDHSYQYANDLIWDLGPAVYLALDDAYTIALRSNLSGEYKGKDEAGGVKEDDTSLNALFIGPELLVSIGDSWAIDLGWDKPVNVENSGLQAVVTSRVRGSVSYRF